MLDNFDVYDIDPKLWYEQVVPRPQLSDLQRNALRQGRDMVEFAERKQAAIDDLDASIGDPRVRALLAVAINGSDDYYIDGGKDGFDMFLVKVSVAAILLASLMDKEQCGQASKCRTCKFVANGLVKLDAALNN